MCPRSLFDLLSPRSALETRRRPSARRRPHPGRLQIEPLEDRCLLSRYSIFQLPLYPMDINGRTQVVGRAPVALPDGGTASHAALWQEGTLTDLGSLAGPGGESFAWAINDAGRVVGWTQVAPGASQFQTAAFLITPEDTNQDGAPDRWYRDDDGNGINDLMTALGAFGSVAYDINAAGQVVGASGGRAVLWRNGDMIDLGSLAASGTQMAALGINDAGQVVGRSEVFAFLLNPEDSDGDGVPDRWYRDSNNDGGNDLMARLGQWGFPNGQAAAVSAGGQVVGQDGYFGFLWTPSVPNGTAGTLAYLGQNIYVEDLNASAEAVGYYFQYYEDGSVSMARSNEGWLIDLIPPDSGWSSLDSAEGINDDGRIVGWGDLGGYLLVPTGEPPAPAITISDATATEGNAGTRPMTFTVTLSAASGQAVTVAYTTVGSGAAEGADYRAASDTLTFAPGETSKAITVLVNGDRLGEADESFFVDLTSPNNATLADGQGVGTIVDDEPRVSIGDVTRYEGKRGQTALFMFTVTLSAAYDQPVTVSFKTTDGTARTSDNDYIARTGTLTFAPGETTKTVTIEVRGDSKREANETFYLDLSGLSGNAVFTKNRGVGTILNDD